MEWYWWLLIIAVIFIGIFVVLYFIGKKAESKKADQDKAIAEAAQTVSLLIIDKKKMKLKDAGLPEAVLAQTPWYLKRAKTPIVKVKIGPKVMTLLCAPEIFDTLPVKKEVKAVISGLYLTAVKGAHGAIKPVEQKKGFLSKLRKKAGM